MHVQAVKQAASELWAGLNVTVPVGSTVIVGAAVLFDWALVRAMSRALEKKAS